MRYIDLFCGIGAFHQAMDIIGGGECVYACDIDKNCRETYYENYGINPDSDITKINVEDIPEHDILFAGFPCQSFSKAGKRLGFADDTKGTLFFDVCRILEYHKPKYALLENVRNLASHDNGHTWETIRFNLDSLGYNVLAEPVIFSPHYIGIPQHRERVFIICIRKDVGEVKPFEFDTNNIPQCNIDDILLNDEEIENLKGYQLNYEMVDLFDLWNEFINNIKCEKLPTFPIWTEYFTSDEPNVDGLPKWKQNFIRKNHELYNSNKDFIDIWITKAKQNPYFTGSKSKFEWQVKGDSLNIWDNIAQIRPSGIRVKDATYFPALVAIVQTSIVGKLKRFITPRECARLQSFPDSFICDKSDRKAYQQFGNSINVKVAELFIRHMLDI